jgi:hypothetical protein
MEGEFYNPEEIPRLPAAAAGAAMAEEAQSGVMIKYMGMYP